MKNKIIAKAKMINGEFVLQENVNYLTYDSSRSELTISLSDYPANLIPGTDNYFYKFFASIKSNNNAAFNSNANNLNPFISSFQSSTKNIKVRCHNNELSEIYRENPDLCIDFVLFSNVEEEGELENYFTYDFVLNSMTKKTDKIFGESSYNSSTGFLTINTLINLNETDFITEFRFFGQDWGNYIQEQYIYNDRIELKVNLVDDSKRGEIFDFTNFKISSLICILH